MSIWLLYLIFVICPNLNTVFNPVATLAAIMFCVILIVHVFTRSIGNMGEKDAANVADTLSKYIKGTTWVMVISLFFLLITPNDKQIWTIAGGYVVTNSAELQKLPSNILKTANAYLEKMQQSDDKGAAKQ